MNAECRGIDGDIHEVLGSGLLGKCLKLIGCETGECKVPSH